MEVTAELARFSVGLSWDDIPASARWNASLAMIDSIGTVFAGLAEDSVAIVRDLAFSEMGSGEACVFGTGKRLTPSGAALCNGAAAHALDFDSISLTVSGFIASPTLFAILALAEVQREPVSGRRLLESFVAGWEIEAAIARGLGVEHYSRGWHSTATLGHFGAAVGACRLLGLDQTATRSAIGVAASEASGLRTMIGNMTNPFHVGKAARNGVSAALLAADGFKADQNVIEHPFGFAVAFNGARNFNLEKMVSGLGTDWDLVDPGLVLKIYPCCGLIHSAIDAAITLKTQIPALEDIESVKVAVHALVPPTMKFDRPSNGYEAKFSTPFCIATALQNGSVTLSDFSKDRTEDPTLLRLMGCIKMHEHPDLLDPSTFLDKEFSEVTIRLRSGKTLMHRVNRIDNKGSYGNPADLETVSAKFEDCIRSYPRRKCARRALSMLADIDAVKDVRTITELLL
jgi:2-methylcitrate dehydratase PrpD